VANNIRIVLEIDNQRFVGGVKQAEQATKDFANSASSDAKKVENSFNGLNNKTLILEQGFTKLKAALAGAAFVGFARSALQLSDAIIDLSDATGVAIKEIVGLRSAMQAFGGESADADKALLTFFQNIDQAAQGSEGTQAAFGRLGITLKDLGTLSEADLFRKTIEALGKMPESAAKTALQADLLGKSFRGIKIDPTFITTLDEGAEAAALQAEQIQRASDLNGEFEKSFDRIRLAFLEAFGPLFKGLADLLEKIPQLTTAFKVLGVVIVGVFAATGLRTLISLLGMAGRGVSALASGFSKLRSMGGVSKALTGPAQNRGIASLRDSATAVGLAAGGAAAATAMFGGEEEATTAATQRTANAGRKATEAQASAARTIVDALQKQRDAIKDLGNAYDDNLQKSFKVIENESKMITMSEQQKEVFRSRTQFEQQAADAIDKLNQQKIKTNGKLNAEIDIEINKIKERRDIALAAIDAEIAKKYEALVIDRARVQNMEAMFEIQNKVKDLQDTYLLNTLGGIERQLKQIEVQERRVRDAAIQRFEVENRNLPPDEFARRRAEEYARLDKVFQESVANQQAATKVGFDQSRTFSAGWNTAFREYVDNATNAALAAQRIFQKTTQSMEDAIVNFAKTGKFEFKSFINSILEELLRSQVRQLIAQSFGGIGSGGGSKSTIGRLLGFANGGIIPTNGPVIVGERGPEILSGAAGRVVTPNNQLGGTTVTYNINAVDASSFKQLVARDPAFLYAVTQQGAKSIPQTRR
jgi:lambda family phage tail tape measure protein